MKWPEWDETYDVFEIDKSRTKNLELHYDYNMSSCVYTKKSLSNNVMILKKNRYSIIKKNKNYGTDNNNQQERQALS